MPKPFSIEAWYKAISAHDPARLCRFLLPEIRYEDVPTMTVSEGPEAVLIFFERVWAAIPDMQMVPTSTLQTTHRIAAEWVATGTHLGDFPGLPATGNSFHVRGVSIIELSGGLVRRVSDYWDLATSGLLTPAAPPANESHKISV
jgi:steroid delta-isomerase-like uncharacterized protein